MVKSFETLCGIYIYIYEDISGTLKRYATPGFRKLTSTASELRNQIQNSSDCLQMY